MKRESLKLAAVVAIFTIVGTANVATAQAASLSDRWSGFWNSLAKPAASSPQAPTPTPQPAAAQPATAKYAALGDSVAAGVGLPAVSPATGTDAQCGRSTQSYAYTVSNTIGIPLTHAACSGATAGDLFTKQGVAGPNITSQLSTAYAGGRPSLITITAGANDAHWDSFIRACYATSCANASTTLLANTYLTALGAKLHLALSDITLHSAGVTPPTVVLTGYYNPLSASCAVQQSNITAEEITWLTAETTALNQTIANAARSYPFAKFVPIDFNGHDICSSDSWVQGLTASAPFHPTATGQQVIAKAVLASLGR